ncbi:MAG TPA: acyclic terpene utilization AtuA family protein, partial [Deltaproteobacteria bacterium]|nr:acyclic terpene utilization AtuA family protein [Deltaproteobacteria bacterium]
MRDDNGKKTDKVIIANCSGFFRDRLSAAKEMVQGGPIDFLTGDYLAELTMAILFRSKMKDPGSGYVSTFLRQMEQVMGECLDRKIRVVSNAGGL